MVYAYSWSPQSTRYD